MPAKNRVSITLQLHERTDAQIIKWLFGYVERYTLPRSTAVKYMLYNLAGIEPPPPRITDADYQTEIERINSELAELRGAVAAVPVAVRGTNDALRAELAELRAELERLKRQPVAPSVPPAELANLRAELAELRAENARLKAENETRKFETGYLYDALHGMQNGQPLPDAAAARNPAASRNAPQVLTRDNAAGAPDEQFIEDVTNAMMGDDW